MKDLLGLKFNIDGDTNTFGIRSLLNTLTIT